MKGNPREAVRIATAVRVIVHQTKNGKSILTHFGSPNPDMLSTAMPMGPNVVFGESGLTMMSVGPQGMTIEPTLDRITKRVVPFQDWWQERVFTLNGVSLTRKDLVLTAADKDGGAHVDADLPANYEMLANGLWTAVVEGSPAQKMQPQAMVTLVQIGFEMNHSPGILALLGQPPPAFLS